MQRTGHDYMNYMDFMDFAVRCLRKAVKLTHCSKHSVHISVACYHTDMDTISDAASDFFRHTS